MRKKSNTLVIIFIIISIILISTGVAGTVAKKPNEDMPTIDTPIERPDEPETPDVPEEPEVISPQAIDVKLENFDYISKSNGANLSHYLNVVDMAEVPNKTENVSGNVLSIEWRSGTLVSINIDLENYDLSKMTHLTFWVGSEPDEFDSPSGYAKFVQDASLTIFNTGKYFIEADKNAEDFVANKPSTTVEDYLHFGEWKKYEIPIQNVIDCYETNGKITFFHFMSSSLSSTTVYLTNVQFENLAQ